MLQEREGKDIRLQLDGGKLAARIDVAAPSSAAAPPAGDDDLEELVF